VPAHSLIRTKAIVLVRGVIKRASDKSVICSRLRTIALMAFRPFRTCNNIGIIISISAYFLYFVNSAMPSRWSIYVCTLHAGRGGERRRRFSLNFSTVDEQLLKYLCRVHFTNNLGFPLALRTGEVTFVLTGSSKLGTSCNLALLLMADGDWFLSLSLVGLLCQRASVSMSGKYVITT
jgi:hypothetical protein